MLTGEGSSRRLDAENYWRFKLKGKRPIRLEPVALSETLVELGDVGSNQETVLLIPTSNFDATPYDNIVQAILYRNHRLHATTLNCYGSALAYLTEGIVSYCQRHHPTPEQLVLFVESLRDHLHAYVICPQSTLLEPTVHPLRAFVATLFGLSSVYQSDALAWKRLTMNHIGQALKQHALSDCHVWIDSHNSERYAKQMRTQLKKWRVADQHIVCNQLPHTSTSFPHKFALVTIAPNKQKIKTLAEWSLRWQEPTN